MLVRKITKILRGGLDVAGKQRVETDLPSKTIRADHKDLSLIRTDTQEVLTHSICNKSQTVVKGGNVTEAVRFNSELKLRVIGIAMVSDTTRGVKQMAQRQRLQ